jgi:hypothetical protein
MASILSAIRDLLPDEQLRTRMAERLPLHIPGGGAIDPAAILTLAEIEQALARGAISHSSLRIFAGYRQLDLEKAGVVRNGEMRALAIRSLARQGTTIVVNNIQALSPALWELACDAERWLQARVALAAVVSFGQSGIELHYDFGDLIALQLEGRKQWRFFGEAVRGSGRSCADYDGTPPSEMSGEAEMAPGDLLYVPSGLFHRCTPGPYSLHLAIAALHRSGDEFVKHAAAQAQEAAAQSEPLQRFLGSEALLAQAEALKRRMIARIEAVDPVQWLADVEAARARVHGVELIPRAVADGSGRAVLNVTAGPWQSEGKLRAAGATADSLPASDALIALLGAGPSAIATLPDMLPAHPAEAIADALKALTDAGFVRIEP